ncbi:MAG: phenylacetate-CoA oxygenase/reductase subunit PaaK [Bacteroidetes bacterium]|nr:MAG: phenylacetate-CoA oxygenase/reductase subunit PaaK [Bacteroidota bacterium]
MVKFYPLKVQSIERTTPDCSIVTFAVDEDLRPVFDFKQGQYLTLKAQVNGQELRRSYSLCSSPLDKEWKVAIKRIPDGRFSTFANEVLRPGDTLEVMPPQGRFYVEVAPDQARQYVAFAAGSGITPIMSIIKTHLQLEPKSTFKLFYVNRTVSSIILKEELEGLKNLFIDRFEIFHFLTREPRATSLFNGRIDEQKLDVLFKTLIDKEAVDEYFLCGPNEMIFLIKDYLEKLGVDKGHIHFELFNTDGMLAAPRQRTTLVKDQGLTKIIIREGGKDFEFSIPPGSGSILDAALERQLDLPFACKGGVCCTCRAKLVEGEVDILLNYGLEEDEIAAGYILSCQAIPTSDKVVVDFDAALAK